MDGNSFRQEWFLLSRTYIGQIAAVDVNTGTLDVVILEGLGSKRRKLEVPHKVSVQGARDSEGRILSLQKSSWSRYMPDVNDYVYVAFSPKGEARVIGMASMPGFLEEVSTLAGGSQKSKFPYGDYVTLKPGEWDQRSSGGAYISGSRDGTLLLSAGPLAQLRLIKQSEEARGKCGLWDFASEGSSVRLGDIKRTLPTAPYKESDVSDLDVTAPKEFKVSLQTPLGLLISDSDFGGVRNSLGVPVVSTIGVPSVLRSRRRIFVPGSPVATPATTSFQEEVDALGSVRVTQGTTALRNELVAPTVSKSELLLASDTVASTSASLSGAVSASLQSAAIASVTGGSIASLSAGFTANVDAPIVLLGTVPLAVNPAVHGAVLATILITSLGAQLALAQAMVGLEGGPITPKGALWQALATTLTAQLAVLAVPAGPTALLSTKVFVE